MRLPLSVGKERLIFTFQARALSNYRGLVPCFALRRAQTTGCAVGNRAYGDENAAVGALCKRASSDARLETAPTEFVLCQIWV